LAKVTPNIFLPPSKAAAPVMGALEHASARVISRHQTGAPPKTPGSDQSPAALHEQQSTQGQPDSCHIQMKSRKAAFDSGEEGQLDASAATSR